MYDKSLPPDEALLDFLRRVHAEHLGSLPGNHTSLGVSSYEVLAGVVRPDEGQPAILDLACGDGELVEVLLARWGQGCDILGVDMSPEQIALAQARFPQPNVLFRCALAQALPLPDHSVDYVLCHLALMLMRPLEAVLAEVGRVLRPGGTFSAIVGHSGGGESINQAYTRALEARLHQEAPDLLAVGLGDRRIFSERAMGELVAATGLFESPIARTDFDLVLDVTANEYLEFVSHNYFWYVLSDAARADFRAQIEGWFAPLGGQRARIPIAFRQLTLTRGR